MDEKDQAEIYDLYESVGWIAYTKNPDRLWRAFANSQYMTEKNNQGEIVALIRWVTDQATVVLIQDLLVHPDYQRKGLGKKLMQRALAEIKSYGQLQIEVLTDDEETTVSFYKSLGFRSVNDGGMISLVQDTRY
ncbi:GNAT family N-acetyltransferase [Weissella cibaria]|uniref:GNAT family N-acetyltransferase n=1 Tax=Weissella cibaria TaxID=137591 RepID=A0A9Q8N8K5_9LACO|nr:GNAT family N-acetyltransferase [Weissella cibaria]QDG81460.1 GNAT family N-acetyltransferase [Weissella cibaria]QMU88386.1 GNAT family N-acetyltransferase [Weissella cibaria]TVV26756.1 GNAT family N-acetyltransferase [Weissella cibaria]TVV35472.1 GNAT family N-acetyltransferase [Weissella cibaria]TVV39956.1 GNAT family N-acetyltransferase [Weissella cibaria]